MCSGSFIPILQKRKLQHKDFKQLAQVYTASKWQSQDSKQGLFESRVPALSTLSCQVPGSQPR